jgi:GH24 family phage-related lysozyme (muramidase)
MLSENSLKLILDFEVGGGENYYNKFLKNPTWPGEQSGVTIGVGYDCGYVNKTEFTNDWKELNQKDFDKLYKVVGVKGYNAKELTKRLKDIIIPWELGLKVFMNKTVSKFYNLGRDTFPNFDKLPEDAKGGLVSLVFNRGAALEGDRRREMKAIRDIMARTQNFDEKILSQIADEIRKMKRIWMGGSIEKGMSRRRDAEAKLIETALSNPVKIDPKQNIIETDKIIKKAFKKE